MEESPMWTAPLLSIRGEIEPTMTRHDPVRRPGLVTEALRHRGLVNPEAEEAYVRDVLGGGRATGAPRTDAERFAADDELVGAGPEEQEDFVYGRPASPDA